MEIEQILTERFVEIILSEGVSYGTRIVVRFVRHVEDTHIVHVHNTYTVKNLDRLYAASQAWSTVD